MATARKNFKRGGKPLADAPSAEEAGGFEEHRKAHGDEKTGEKAEVPQPEARNAEGGVEAEGVPEAVRHPRTSRATKSRERQTKPGNAPKTKHARTGKAKPATHG
ncbi:MAG TPA: hypothetical protein VEK08_15030 [Planctomycetota bacterium]|nr:hypothetical protein [Planctomycetota bacterium]